MAGIVLGDEDFERLRGGDRRNLDRCGAGAATARGARLALRPARRRRRRARRMASRSSPARMPSSALASSASAERRLDHRGELRGGKAGDRFAALAGAMNRITGGSPSPSSRDAPSDKPASGFCVPSRIGQDRPLAPAGQGSSASACSPRRSISARHARSAAALHQGGEIGVGRDQRQLRSTGRARAPRRWGRSSIERHGEGAALAGLARQRDRAAHQLDELLGDGKAETGTAETPRLRDHRPG